MLEMGWERTMPIVDNGQVKENDERQGQGVEIVFAIMRIGIDCFGYLFIATEIPKRFIWVSFVSDHIGEEHHSQNCEHVVE